MSRKKDSCFEISDHDPLKVIDFLENQSFPLPSFDDTDETVVEFSSQYRDKIAELFRIVCGDNHVCSSYSESDQD